MKNTLVFLHGFLGTKEDWNEIISYLEPKYNCFALDLPGHGSTPYCEDWEEDIFEEIADFSTPIHLIGYSMGGRVAMRLIDKYPKIFAKKIFNNL